MVVRTFDSSRQDVRGEIDLPIQIKPHIFQITFQVMDINLVYNCLLGQPWIHSAPKVEVYGGRAVNHSLRGGRHSHKLSFFYSISGSR